MSILTQPASDPPKKGRRPGREKPGMLFVHDRDPNFKYLWQVNDPMALASSESDGYERVSGVSGGPKVTVEGGGTVNDGRALTTIREVREMVLMRIPVQDAEEIADWNQEEALAQVRGIERAAQQKMAGAEQRGAAPTKTMLRID